MRIVKHPRIEGPAGRVVVSALLMTSLLAIGPAPARAQCSCLCVDGSYRTVCTTPEAVRESGELCQALAGRGCPVSAADGEVREYAAPVDGAVNCRDARIYDAAADEHVTARFCDLGR